MYRYLLFPFTWKTFYMEKLMSACSSILMLLFPISVNYCTELNCGERYMACPSSRPPGVQKVKGSNPIRTQIFLGPTLELHYFIFHIYLPSCIWVAQYFSHSASF